MNVANRVDRVLWTLALSVVNTPVKAQPQTPPDSSAVPPWMQVAYLKASHAQAYDHFGCGGATGINGDQADNSLFGARALNMFTRAGGTWVQWAYSKLSNAGFDDQFGSTVTLSGDGDTLAVRTLFESSASAARWSAHCCKSVLRPLEQVAATVRDRDAVPAAVHDLGSHMMTIHGPVGRLAKSCVWGASR